ncbi:MAG: hypothetical protein PHS47_00025 [Methanocellales archaeon]|nr:hypothetical protein [Methanocellales archaeon]MDD3420678.1 hypothetical protein [Methanocellales archaeon]MDD4897850.1 hypothetical protein [Methanocellales archaeon]MDD5447387.1 hypothetical protein [Methanocellales archaeon]
MKKIATLLLSFFIVAMSAGCVESNIPEAKPTVTPMPISTPTQKATLIPEMSPDIRKINRDALGQRTYTKLTPEMAEELRNIKQECPYCHHDWPYSIIIVEIDGELWWVCEGVLENKWGWECSYIKKVTEKSILGKYGYME